MKTILIYDTRGEQLLKFIVVEGDVSHLHDTYVNNMTATEENVDELNALVFYPEGHPKAWDYIEGVLLDTFPVDQVESDTKVIVVGFEP